MRISRILSPFFSLALLFTMQFAATACSCIPTPSPKTALKEADAVFTGKVTKLEKFKDNKTGENYKKITVNITHIWKGIENKNAVVLTPKGEGGCEYPFQRDETYLIYAYRGKKTPKMAPLHTNICTRTKLFKTAKEDLKFLGKGKAPKTK